MITGHLQEQYLTNNKGNIYKEGKNNQEMRTLQERIDTKRPLDPFYDVNPQTHKVVINHGNHYNCTSQKEIFLQRLTK